MMNKVIIGILVLLVIITGGIGYYSYTLNQQLDDLVERLATFETEQTTRIDAVSDELKKEMAKGLDSLENQLGESQADIAALGVELETASDRISGVEDEIAGVSTQVGTLDDRISSAEAEILRSVIDTSELYKRVVQATVRITNGERAVGSGFIYDTDGRVITAYHVVDGLSPIFVMLYDGRISRATVDGYCEFSDVALLTLSVNPDIEPLPLGDSSLIQIGEPVIAIGSPGDGDDPLGLRDTLTSGIISQVNRFVNIEGSYIPNLLQFDAAVNFGNSGGPLINSKGEVIGLVNARIDPLIGEGIYWAVSSNKVKRVVEALLEHSYLSYPWVGVMITDLTPQMVQEMSLETANGVLVTALFPDSPAEIAGIQTGDIIVAIDGVPVRDTSELTSYLGEYNSPGDETVIEVIRGTTTLEISVVIGTRE
ncbi:MAG: trypsin-like peptidase domain-containing protein [Dehalococcoidales bacterium]|nr:trypsin-like peptidase domain-containing protein [Dehalococcoidales bacterium]